MQLKKILFKSLLIMTIMTPIIVFLVQINWIRYYKLSNDYLTTSGVIISVNPEVHMRGCYTYDVENIKYSYCEDGIASDYKTHDNALVFYERKNPQNSSLTKPHDLLVNETTTILIAAIILPIFFIFVFRKI